jgi:ABC-2 type transport system ATP-binding protein
MAAPPVLFLDEPTTGLDPRSRIELWNLLGELVRDGATLLLTTQYLEEADRLADDIVVLDGGRIAAQGRHEELLKSSRLYRRMCARLSVGKSLDEPESVDELIEAAKR